MRFKCVLFAQRKEKKNGCQKDTARLSLSWEWEPPKGCLKPSRLQAGARELGGQKAAMQEDWLLRKRGLMMESCLTSSRPGFWSSSVARYVTYFWIFPFPLAKGMDYMGPSSSDIQWNSDKLPTALLMARCWVLPSLSHFFFVILRSPELRSLHVEAICNMWMFAIARNC